MPRQVLPTPAEARRPTPLREQASKVIIPRPPAGWQGGIFMEREKILEALAQTYERAYQEYRTLMALGTQLLKDGKQETYRDVEQYANGKSCLLDGISLAAAFLGIEWDELTRKNTFEEVQA